MFASNNSLQAAIATAIVCWTSSGLAEGIADLAKLAPGWRGELVAKVDQSYCGWGVTVGDADNDGRNEILATGAPDSRLYLFRKNGPSWQTQLLADRLARRVPAMGLAVQVVDLNGDGRNEVILGTGQEASEPAYFYVLQTDGRRITHQIFARPFLRDSAYTHNFACRDLNNDGVQEVLSAYCGSGEIVRYDIAKDLSRVTARKLHKHTGSGEDAWIADVDNDGRPEFITSNGYREGRGMVEIFDFDARGELVTPARIAIDGFDGQKCFLGTAAIGDVNNDGRTELIVGWNRNRMVNRGTIIVYRVEGKEARPLCTLTKEDPELGYGYFGQLMLVDDVDNDGRKELAVTTRCEPAVVSGHADGGGPARVFLFKVAADHRVERTLLAIFRPEVANSCWPALGDADNSGKKSLVIATGLGVRTQPGTSYVVMLKKAEVANHL